MRKRLAIFRDEVSEVGDVLIEVQQSCQVLLTLEKDLE